MVSFCKVDIPSSLIPIVEQRLPTSCFVFNQLKFHKNASDDIQVFSYGSELDNCWILTKYFREDRGMVISISAPNYNAPEISKEIREYIHTSGIIDWEKRYVFNSLQAGYVTKLITDLLVEDLGHVITIYPCHLFHMETSVALELEMSNPPLPGNAVVRRLDVESGVPFISNNWKYSMGASTHTRVGKCIQRFPSGGLYLDNKLVSGAIIQGFGLVSMLHTDPEERRKGYASHVMRYIFKELAREGLQPCVTSEIENKAAVKFHRTLGLQQVTQVNYVGSVQH